MYRPNAECDCCKKRWIAQMREQGITFHLCARHTNELISARAADERHNSQAIKWVNAALSMQKGEKLIVEKQDVILPALAS